METAATRAWAFVLSLGVHALCVLFMLAGLSWTRTARPVSVPGPVIEATLVSYTPPPRAASRKPPIPVKPAPPKPEPTPVETPLPPAPPRADDTLERERIDRMALEAAENAEREQEERRKREQELLDAEELTQMERERQEQLEDIRRLREEAQERREHEEQQLAMLEERENDERAERERMDELLEQEQATERAGTEGLDESLLARYVFTLQQIVTQNWLRPDTAAPGLKCTVRIVQIPGGEVLSASVVPPCNGDELTRRSLEAAVLRAQPLPYQGYESVFSRSVDFVFHYDG